MADVAYILLLLALVCYFVVCVAGFSFAKKHGSKNWFTRAGGKGRFHSATWQGLVINMCYFFGFPLLAWLLLGFLDHYFPQSFDPLVILIALFFFSTVLFVTIMWKKGK